MDGSIETISKQLNNLYLEANDLKNDALKFELLAKEYLPDGTYNWLHNIDRYTSVLEKQIRDICTKIQLYSKPHNSMQEEDIKKKQDIFKDVQTFIETVGSVPFSYGLKDQDKECDPFKNFHIRTDWKDAALNSFISEINIKNIDKEILEKKYIKIKFLCNNFDPAAIYNKLLKLTEHFVNSDLVDAYSQFRKDVNSDLGIKPVDMQLPPFTRDSFRPRVFFVEPEEDYYSRYPIIKKMHEVLISNIEKDTEFEVIYKDILNLLEEDTKSKYKALRIANVFPMGYMLVPNEGVNQKVQDTRLDALGGLHDVKDELGLHFKKFVSGDKTRHHILLYGPSGTGKTSVVFAFVNAMEKLNLISVESPHEIDFLKSALKDDKRRYILYIDDKSTFGASSEEIDLWARVIDGDTAFPENMEIVITTNMEHLEDKMVQRFGITRKIGIADNSERMEVVDILSRRVSIDVSAFRDNLSRMLDGLSNREIKTIFEEAQEKEISTCEGFEKVINLHKQTKESLKAPPSRLYG